MGFLEPTSRCWWKMSKSKHIQTEGERSGDDHYRNHYRNHDASGSSLYTPGPWRFSPNDLYVPGGIAPEVFDRNSCVVARTYAWGPTIGHPGFGARLTGRQQEARRLQGNANAALIAAAPEMLEMLEKLYSVAWVDLTDAGELRAKREIGRLIDRAKGKAP